MQVSSRVNATLCDLALLRLGELRPDLGLRLVGTAVDSLLDRVDSPLGMQEIRTIRPDLQGHRFR